MALILALHKSANVVLRLIYCRLTCPASEEDGRRRIPITSPVEWYAHHPVAFKAGLSESVVADPGRRPAGMQPDEAVVYDFCMELSTQHSVSDAMFKRAKEMFTDQWIVDLIAVSGTYVMVAMLLNAAEEPAPGPT